MAGKSSYIKQVALITILSHVGSFVPAEYVHMPPIDKVFARVGTSDSILGNASTFFLEMQEMALIIANATPSSLIIIDELGRGTSNQDGVGIAWACCEHLISLRAPTLFATHFSELVQLASLSPSCQNLHLGVEARDDGLHFLYRVQKGVAEECSYGMYAAESAAFPRQVLSFMTYPCESSVLVLDFCVHSRMALGGCGNRQRILMLF
jgi:DNA mismatch repair ATPase MutS